MLCRRQKRLISGGRFLLMEVGVFMVKFFGQGCLRDFIVFTIDVTIYKSNSDMISWTYSIP